MASDPDADTTKLKSNNLSRRELLRTAAAVGVSAAVAPAAGCARPPQTPAEAPPPAAGAKSPPPAPPPAATGAVPMRTLGRTGLQISEVGVGGYPLDDPDVLLYARDRGINYVDTAHCYRGGASERAIGEALQGRRDQFIVTTKWCPHHIGQPARKQVFLDMLDESLRRLRTDHVDIVLNHEVGRHSDGEGTARLQSPEMLEAFAAAKQAGKVRFLGASGHDGDLMEVMRYAVAAGSIDVLLCRYSFLDYPEQQQVIDEAHRLGVGVIAMKTLAGAKGADLDRFRDRHLSFKQAALRWVLSNPKMSGLVISIASRRQVDEYAAAPGALSAADQTVLDEYAALFSDQVCRFCNACESACPGDVRIADILRFAMYHDAYDQSDRATASYARLLDAERAAHCANCAGMCAESCGYDLPVRSLLLRAHATLAGERT